MNEEFTDDNEYILTNSVQELFYGKPWKVPLVELVYNDNKEPLVFVFYEIGHNMDATLKKLPTEFFSHQLLDYDCNNPESLLNFMNKFGVFDFQPVDLGKHKRFKRIIENIDISDDYQVSDFNKEFGGFYDTLLYRNSNQYETFREYNQKIAKNIKTINENLKENQEERNILKKTRCVGFQNVVNATHNYENWIFASKRIKAMVTHKTIEEIASYTGDEPINTFRACEGAVNIVQSELKKVSPILDIFNFTEGRYETKNGDYYGSLSQALALQLWNFSLEAKKGFSICKECGEPFVHKQTKSKTQQSRNTHVFCCDRCKNRNAQRKYRQTEGYKLKLKKKKEKESNAV